MYLNVDVKLNNIKIMITSIMPNLDIVKKKKKKQRHHFAEKGPERYGFSSSHARIWELDHKEIWALKNWCFLNVVLEKFL